ncbi:hypothetical protein [Candidatus Nitrospira bockiana]
MNLSLVVAASAAVFVVDLVTPLGWGIASLYIFPILLTVKTPSRRASLGVTGLCTAFTLGGWYRPPAAVVPEVVAFNRFIGLTTLWTAAYVVCRQKASRDLIAASRSSATGRG